MNPYGYNERYMHSQRDPLWKDKHLGQSDAHMSGFGCLVSVSALMCSYVLGRDVTPGELCDWLNAHGGFTANGELIYDAVRRYTGGRLWLSSTWNPIGNRFVVKCVSVAKQTHFVLRLIGKDALGRPIELISDSLQLPPNSPVQPGNKYPDFRIPRRLYFKAR